MLDGAISSVDEANIINHGMHLNDIYNCSWGPFDNGHACDGPDKLAMRAFIHGVLNGRRGLGNLFVFAAGNGVVIQVLFNGLSCSKSLC